MSGGQSITVFATIDAPAADLAQILAAVTDLARLSTAEPGCLRYEVYQSSRDPGRLIIHEIWADAAALERHRGMAHVAVFKAVLPGTSKVWASPFDRLA